MLSLFRSNVVDLPTNISLSYLWCGGFMVGIFMVFQVATGVVLSFLYVADSGLSFSCVLGLTSEWFYAWVIRYCHVWGATFIFVLLFIHMGRSLYYSSYVKVGVWNVGFVLYLLMMVEAFLGYVLPWHQMSYWAATVLTSVLNSVPIVGASLYKFIVGGFSVTNVTLVRVFSSHVCLAFLILLFSVVHLCYLHWGGSNNPLFSSGGYGDVVAFHSFYTNKDGAVLSLVVCLFALALLVCPDAVLDVESYTQADPLLTPVSIKPEWYFLAFYAMLRSVESKLGGLVLVMVFLILLWVPCWNESSSYFFDRQILFWFSVCLFVLLSYLGACHPEPPYVWVGASVSFGSVVSLSFYKGCWVAPHTSSGVRWTLADRQWLLW